MGHFGLVCTKFVKSSRKMAVPPLADKNWKQIKEREFRKLIILGKTTEFQIDSGADLSIIGDGLM